MSFLQAQVIFPSNFASIFSSIKNNSSILFLAQTLSDLSTWENCLPRDFDYNSIQNTNILGGAFGNSLTSKLLLFTKIWPNNSNVDNELVLPWIYVAITKIKHQLIVVQEYLHSILVQFKVHTVRCHHNIKQISETHSELCKTRMIELFCENNEQLKGVIYIPKRALSQMFHWALNTPVFRKFSIQLTLHQGLKCC